MFGNYLHLDVKLTTIINLFLSFKCRWNMIYTVISYSNHSFNEVLTHIELNLLLYKSRGCKILKLKQV